MQYKFLLAIFFIFSFFNSGHDTSLASKQQNNKHIISRFLSHKKNSITTEKPFWETRKKKDPITDSAALKQSNWYADAIKGIEVKEYEINYDEQLKSYSSPNRQQNLRASYSCNKFTLTPRNDSADKWKLQLTMLGVYAGKQLIYAPSKDAIVTTAANKIHFNNNNEFITEYINSEEGVRQNFIINKNPLRSTNNDQRTSVSIKLQTNKNWFINQVNKKEIHFAKATNTGYDKKITYNDLKVWDANQKELEASFVVNKNTISIDVITTGAVYPITIDPISLTANWSVESNQVSAQMGYSVSTAGDVNGDGYSDVIVGSPLYDNGETDEGKVFVYHGSATGLSASAAWSAESNQVNARMGYCANTAGDVNGDGYSDVIVGVAYYDNGQTDEGRAYVYYGSASGLAASPAWTTESDQANSLYSFAVACAGDVNGDGYSDVIVGAPYYDNGETDEGRAFVYHGSSTGLSLTANWTGESNQAFASYGGTQSGLIGYGIGSAGDVNGDGYSDIIIAATGYDNGQTDEGRAFVYHGSSTGLSVAANWTFESDQVSAILGNSVASAGDVNGDGYGDVIVGDHAYDNGETDEGRAWVFYGSSTGLGVSPAWTNEVNQINAEFGCSVACAGDVNNDGYADIIVGALTYTNGQSSEGRAYAYFGSATGLPATANWTAEPNLANALFGGSVFSAGDVNGDGYSDVIVGALGYNNGQSFEGGAFVYHGSASGLSTTLQAQLESNQANAGAGFSVASAGDVNGDGYSDVIVGVPSYDNGQTDEGAAFVYHGSSTGLNSTIQVQLESNQANAFMGGSVACAGDVNGDGYSDVIVGAQSFDNGQTNEGAAFVYHGSAAGITTTIQTQLESNQADAIFGGFCSRCRRCEWGWL